MKVLRHKLLQMVGFRHDPAALGVCSFKLLDDLHAATCALPSSRGSSAGLGIRDFDVWPHSSHAEEGASHKDPQPHTCKPSTPRPIFRSTTRFQPVRVQD